MLYRNSYLGDEFIGVVCDTIVDQRDLTREACSIESLFFDEPHQLLISLGCFGMAAAESHRRAECLRQLGNATIFISQKPILVVEN